MNLILIIILAHSISMLQNSAYIKNKSTKTKIITNHLIKKTMLINKKKLNTKILKITKLNKKIE